MRKLIAFVAISALAVPAVAQVHVRGYVRKDGTYVAPHVQSAPNNTKLDNYSTKGNYNPYTGKEGTVDPYKPTTPSPSYEPYKAPCYYNCKK